MKQEKENTAVPHHCVVFERRGSCGYVEMQAFRFVRTQHALVFFAQHDKKQAEWGAFPKIVAEIVA